MRCEYVFLTHFSQRYPKIAPTAIEKIRDNDKNNEFRPNLMKQINIYYSKLLKEQNIEIEPIKLNNESLKLDSMIIVCASDHMNVKI